MALSPAASVVLPPVPETPGGPGQRKAGVPGRRMRAFWNAPPRPGPAHLHSRHESLPSSPSPLKKEKKSKMVRSAIKSVADTGINPRTPARGTIQGAGKEAHPRSAISDGDQALNTGSMRRSPRRPPPSLLFTVKLHHEMLLSLAVTVNAVATVDFHSPGKCSPRQSGFNREPHHHVFPCRA